MAYLNEYEKLKNLGEGGFARVYKVRHNDLGYIRAIRELKQPVDNTDDRVYISFIRECKKLLRIGNGNHPNIVRIYQPRLLNTTALVEMDYINGYSLSEYLKVQNNFIPVDEIIRFVCDISSALAYCHEDVYEFCMDRDLDDDLRVDPNDGSKVLLNDAEREKLISKYSIVHNDIHDGNVMRKHYDSSYILLDFGLAVDGDEVVTSSRTKNGRYEYFAPERFRLQDSPDKRPTTQMDIYSFGILMYQMLAGRVPFMYNKEDAKNSYEVLEVAQYMRKHEEMKVPDIYPLRKAAYESINQDGQYIKDYPEWLELAILKCLEKKPEDRFANGKELYTYVMGHLNEDQKHLQGELKRLADENAQQSERTTLLTNQLNEEKEHLKSELERLTSIINQQGERTTLLTNQLNEEKKHLKSELERLTSIINQQSECTTLLTNQLNEEKKHLKSELERLTSIINQQSEPENNITNANTVDESAKLSSQSKLKETKIRNKKITFYFLISILLVFAYYIISSFIFSKEDKNQLEVNASEQNELKQNTINIENKITFTNADYLKLGKPSVLKVPEGVTHIEDYAFDYCTSLTSITFPNSITHIGEGVFTWCSNLERIVIQNNNFIFEKGILYDKNRKRVIFAPMKITKGPITLPNSVTHIGEGAFYGCASLTSIILPNSITHIGNLAFYSCTDLITITLPNSVTHIGYKAFSSCTDLTSITLRNSITHIGNLAFSSCTDLTSITLPNSITHIGYKAFFDSRRLKNIKVSPSSPIFKQLKDEYGELINNN